MLKEFFHKEIAYQVAGINPSTCPFRTCLLSCLFFLFSAGIVAQTVDANALLEKTSCIIEAWEGVDVQFTLHVYSEKSSLAESFEGLLQMKKNKFVLTTPDLKVWFDGATQWAYNPHSDEVFISTPSGDDLQVLNPMLLLKDYKKDFKATMTGESVTANAKAAYQVELTPKKKDVFEKIEMSIEKNSFLPVKIDLTLRNRLRNTIMIQELKPSVPSDAMFSFPKASFPNAEIIDLR